MAKKQVGIRLEADTITALDSYAEAHGINRTEAIERAVAALTGTEGQQGTETQATDLRAVCDVLRASNADLRAEVARLWAQMGEKDRQIERAHELAEQSHRLHAAEVTRSLPPEGGTTGGIRGRIAALFGFGRGE